MLLAFLALVSLLPSVSLTKPPPKLPRAITSVGPSAEKPTYECFEHSDSDTGHLDIVNRSDCAMALKRIIEADKSKAPIVFSRSPNDGYKVPDQLEAGTCVLHIDVSAEGHGKDVQMPMEAVVHAAMHIIENCIKDQPFWTGLGGHAIAVSHSDSGGALDVVLFGQPPPPVATPRMPYLYRLNPITS